MQYRTSLACTVLASALLLGMPPAHALMRIAQCGPGETAFIAYDIERSHPVPSPDGDISLDFGTLWHGPDQEDYLGFVGNERARLRIWFDRIEQEANRPDRYEAAGRVRYRDHDHRFSGRIVVRQIRLYEQLDIGVEEEEMKGRIAEQGIVLADYRFELDDPAAGALAGKLASSWYRDTSKRLLADNHIPSDGYGNHFFHGQLIEQEGRDDEPANWGMGRIPCAGDLDIGAGEFSLDPRYRANGWE